MKAKREPKKKKLKADSPEFKRWERRGDVLGTAKSSNQWAIVDWLRYGMEWFKTRDVYDRAQKLTGMTRPSLYQFRLMVESFPKISTRVKNLSFGHHRLVAKKEYTPEKRREHLLYARDEDLTVSKFADYLTKLEKGRKRMKETPTNADDAAKEVVELCKDFCSRLSSHLGVRALLRSDPPGERRQVIRELKAAADEFSRIANELEFRWSDYDVGNYYEENRGAAAGGSQ